jgi:hypothetical protein
MLLDGLASNKLPHIRHLSLRHTRADPQIIPLLLAAVANCDALQSVTVDLRIADHMDAGQSGTVDLYFIVISVHISDITVFT